MAKSVVTYEEDASDPTAVWRVAHVRPSEEPRNESFLIQPREMETTRRSDELRRINLKSTQEIQPRGAPEGNLKPPLTGLSEVDEVFGKHEVRLEEVIDGLDGAVSGDFGIPSWLFRTPDYMAPEQWNHQKPSQGPDLAKQWLQNPRGHLNPSQFQYPARQWNSNSSSDRAPSFFKSLAKGPILDSPEFVGGEPLVGAVVQKKETEMKSFTPGACKYCGYKGFSGHKCKQNQHVDLIASEVIVGPDCAGLNMKKGEVALVTIPPEDAIGFTELNQDLAVIPTNSTWIQEVELVLIVKDKESVYAPAMNDTGNLLVPGGIEQVVHVWDPGTGSKNMKWQSSPLGVGGGLTFGVVSVAGRARPHQILDMTDDEADFHMRQGAFLYNFDAQMLPKGYHCFSRRLMLEYSKFSSLDSDEPFACKLNDPKHRNTYKQVYVHVLNYEAILWEKLPKLSMQQLYFVSLLWNLPPWPDLSFCEVHWRAMGMEKGAGAVSRRNAYNMVTRQGKNQFQPTRDKQLTDFVKEWVARVEQYKLKDNEWFSALYSCRKQWAPGYVDHSFWASERGLGIYDDFYVCGHEYLEDIIYIGAREHELEEFLLSVMKEVKDIGFTGASRLIFRPLVDELTCFGAVCFSLRQKKQLDFRLWVIGGEISVIPGNSDTLEGTIKNAIEDSITWSLRKVIPIIPGDYSGLELKSVGIVEVNLGQARDLTNKDVIGKSDPFAILYVPPLLDHTKRSKTINKYADTHSVTVKIYDGDGIQGSELIGCVQVVLNDLQKGKVEDVWLKLVQDLEILRDNIKALMKRVMQIWLPASNALLVRMIFHLPFPSKTQKHHVDNLYEGLLDDIHTTAIRHCDSEGKIATVMKVCIIGPNHVPGQKKVLYVESVQHTVIWMGKKQEYVEDVPCGDIIAVGGLDQFITKNATLTNEKVVGACLIRAMKLSVFPVVGVAVQCKLKSDPIVLSTLEESDEHIIAGAGGLHLNICLKDILKKPFGKTQVVSKKSFLISILMPSSHGFLKSILEGKYAVEERVMSHPA